MRNRKGSLHFVSIIVLIFALSVSSTAAAQGQGEAPILGLDSSTAIPGRYIVVFKPGTPAAEASAAAENARRRGGQVDFVYDAALVGFAGNFPQEALAGLSHNPNVEFIEADQ